MRHLLHGLALSLVCIPAFADEAAIRLIHATTPPPVNVLAARRIASAAVAVAGDMTIDGNGEFITHLIVSAGGGIYDERLDRTSSAASRDGLWKCACPSRRWASPPR